MAIGLYEVVVHEVVMDGSTPSACQKVDSRYIYDRTRGNALLLGRKQSFQLGDSYQTHPEMLQVGVLAHRHEGEDLEALMTGETAVVEDWAARFDELKADEYSWVVYGFEANQLPTNPRLAGAVRQVVGARASVDKAEEAFVDACRDAGVKVPPTSDEVLAQVRARQT